MEGPFIPDSSKDTQFQIYQYIINISYRSADTGTISEASFIAPHHRPAPRPPRSV